MPRTRPAVPLPDQSGRVAIVTGANSGIGFEAASALAGAGAHVVLACRNRVKAKEAIARIEERHPRASLEVVACDLSSQRATRSAADQIRGAHPRLDLLIANAGVMAVPETRTEDGWELQLATNHLGHFALVGLLLDRMVGVPGARVVSVTSNSHRVGRIRFDDLHSERGYRPWRAYAQSKLANLLFSRELARRLAAAGAAATAVAAHPGYAATDLQASSAEQTGNRVAAWCYDKAERWLGRPSSVGVGPTLVAATDPTVAPGSLVGPDRLYLFGAPRIEVPAKRAQDDATAERLWRVSEELTGVAHPV